MIKLIFILCKFYLLILSLCVLKFQFNFSSSILNSIFALYFFCYIFTLMLHDMRCWIVIENDDQNCTCKITQSWEHYHILILLVVRRLESRLAFIEDHLWNTWLTRAIVFHRSDSSPVRYNMFRGLFDFFQNDNKLDERTGMTGKQKKLVQNTWAIIRKDEISSGVAIMTAWVNYNFFFRIHWTIHVDWYLKRQIKLGKLNHKIN